MVPDCRPAVRTAIVHGSDELNASCNDELQVGPQWSSGVGDEEDHHGENHEVGVEQEENTAMIKTPAASQAACDLCHAPRFKDEQDDLPTGAVEVLNGGKPRQQQARDEGAQGEDDAAHERPLSKMKEGEAGTHDSLL